MVTSVQRAWVRAFGRRAASPVAASSRASPNQPALRGPQRQLQGLGVFRKGVFVTLLILQSTLPAPDYHIIDCSAWSGGLR